MKNIPLTEKDLVVEYPKDIPSCVQRIHFNGSFWEIAETKEDEIMIINSCLSLKEIVEMNKSESTDSQSKIL